MKSLDEVEPRTNLFASPQPPGVDTSNPNYHVIISKPGSYYLSRNLDVTKPSGISIQADGVTLDLRGFQIARVSGSGGDAIEIGGTSDRATVAHGSIKGFANGVNILAAGSRPAQGCALRDLAVSAGTGSGLRGGEGTIIEGCRVNDINGSFGIDSGDGGAVSHCTVRYCTVTYGIVIGGRGTMTDCTVSMNTCDLGINLGRGSAISHCAACDNTSASSFSGGIGTNVGCTIEACSSFENKSTAANATGSTGFGFTVGNNSIIQHCAAYSNKGDGIRLATASFALQNTANENGNGGDGAGLHMTGSDNRAERNNSNGNDRGIDVDSGGNLIIGNSASGNTTNYTLVANNVFGAIVNRTAPGSLAVSGNTASSSAGTTDPWANFSY